MKTVTIRNSRKWVKVERDDKKQFTFSIGWEGELKAHKIQFWGTVFKTWEIAKLEAKFMLEE